MPAMTPVDDPNVKIPAAVKATAARANELHGQIYTKEPTKEATKEESPTDAAPKEPAQTDPPKDQGTDPAKAAGSSQDGEVTPKGNDTPTDKNTNWEHAYKSMKGRHDRLQDANRSLIDRVANLENVIASMQASKPADTPAELRPESLITPKEVEDYGKEFLDVVGKKAKETVAGEVVELKNQVATLTKHLQNVGQTVATDARSKMKASLTEQLPNWAAVNVNQDFLNWLQLPDPFSGAIRHTLLKQAWERNETPRVLAFFKGFLAEEAAVAPVNTRPDQNRDAPDNSSGNASGKIPLEQFAAPGRAKSAADNNSPAEKPIITRAQIADFYRDVAASKYRGRDKEKDRLEQMIFAAEREGRIR